MNNKGHQETASSTTQVFERGIWRHGRVQCLLWLMAVCLCCAQRIKHHFREAQGGPFESVKQEDKLTWRDDGLYPRNLRIAFIGDSITRFQYYSLVIYLKTGNWTNSANAKTFDSHQYKSWLEWMSESIEYMQPNEHCDCFRGGEYNRSAGSWWDMTNENRYYRDEQTGNYITFLNKFGKSPVNGHWAPQDVYIGPIALEQGHFTPYLYRYNWSEAIEHLLGNLSPKPDYVVLNAGLHYGHDLGQEQVQQSIMQALNKTGITGIYKTTTHVKQEVRSKSMKIDRRHDHDLCRLTGHCLNMSWTLSLPLHHFNPGDRIHFDYKVNNLMVQQLLHYLKYEFHAGGDDHPPQPVNISTIE